MRKDEGIDWTRKTWSPTGRLSLGIEPLGSGESTVADKPGSFLERRMTEIVAAIEAKHAASVRQREEWDRRDKEYREAEQRRADDARAAEEARKRAAEEAARRAQLFEEIADWMKANQCKRLAIPS